MPGEGLVKNEGDVLMNAVDSIRLSSNAAAIAKGGR